VDCGTCSGGRFEVGRQSPHFFVAPNRRFTIADQLQDSIEKHLERLGYELVDYERAGSKSRPILRLRIDKVDAQEGQGITVDDCRLVSRSLEESLDEGRDVGEQYVLEVSSPGVERPLVRPRDFERFAGSEIAVQSKSVIHAGSKRVVGYLLGLDVREGSEQIRMRLESGEEVVVPREAKTKVNLVYRWGESK
jgi:ribosome maturation factor RimP